MSHLVEFVQHHYLMVAVAVALAAVGIVIEIRHRASGGKAVGSNDAVLLMNAGALVLDVRKAEDFAAGHIIDARNIPHTELAQQADTIKKYREKPVLVYCDSGVTSNSAVNVLKSHGFTKIANLRGGLNAWRQDNLPIVTNSASNNGSGKKKTGKAA